MTRLKTHRWLREPLRFTFLGLAELTAARACIQPLLSERRSIPQLEKLGLPRRHCWRRAVPQLSHCCWWTLKMETFTAGCWYSRELVTSWACRKSHSSSAPVNVRHLATPGTHSHLQQPPHHHPQHLNGWYLKQREILWCSNNGRQPRYSELWRPTFGFCLESPFNHIALNVSL